MADIFISYSKADRLLAEQLAAYLESEGWSVWWDRSLQAGDAYRNEINSELLKARAAIVIWTKSSVVSDWVRAEAGRAKSEGKLIPVKTGDVSYGEIPLPFGEMHTESVQRRELVRAAVVAQLSKPKAAATPLAAAMSTFRCDLLTWFGILGGALTLATNLRALIQLSGFVSVALERWDEWTRAAWTALFSRLPFEVPEHYYPLLTFLVFAAALDLGLNWRRSRARQRGDVLESPSLVLKRPWHVLPIVAGFALVSVGLDLAFEHVLGQSRDQRALAVVMTTLVVVSVTTLARDKLQSLLFSSLFLAFCWLLLVRPMSDMHGSLQSYWLTSNNVLAYVLLREVSHTLNVGIALAMVFILAALASLPARELTRRLFFMLVGLGLMLALSETSKLIPSDLSPK